MVSAENNRESLPSWYGYFIYIGCVSILLPWCDNFIYVGHTTMFITMVWQSHLCWPCSSLYYHDATFSSTSVMQQCLPPWFDRLINVGHVAIFITMARPPHQSWPCSNIYHHGTTASSTSSVCRSTNMVLTASSTSHMWEFRTVVATVPLKLLHVKYKPSYQRCSCRVYKNHHKVYRLIVSSTSAVYNHVSHKEVCLPKRAKTCFINCLAQSMA